MKRLDVVINKKGIECAVVKVEGENVTVIEMGKQFRKAMFKKNTLEGTGRTVTPITLNMITRGAAANAHVEKVRGY